MTAPTSGSTTIADEERTTAADEERAPVVLADGSKRYFQYDLDTDAIADWEEADRDGNPVWEDDDAVHWIDTTVSEPETDRPRVEITIYQEVVFTQDCDGSGIAHPALSPREWAQQDAVSNMDLASWFMLQAVDEVKAAFDYVVWTLHGLSTEPPEKYGVRSEAIELFRGETYPGACRLQLIGVDPQQIVEAGNGPLPAAQNGFVTLQIPAIPRDDWAHWSSLSFSASVEPPLRPHQLVPKWEDVLTEPVAVEFAPRRRFDKLVGRERCEEE